MNELIGRSTIRNHAYGGLQLMRLSCDIDGNFDVDISKHAKDEPNKAILRITALSVETGKTKPNGKPEKKLAFTIQRPPSMGPEPIWWGPLHDDACRLFLSQNGDRLLQRYRDIYLANPGLCAVQI